MSGEAMVDNDPWLHGADGWVAPDPGHKRWAGAVHTAYHYPGELTLDQVRALIEVYVAYDYLLTSCQPTERLVRQLRILRRTLQQRTGDREG